MKARANACVFQKGRNIFDSFGLAWKRLNLISSVVLTRPFFSFFDSHWVTSHISHLRAHCPQTQPALCCYVFRRRCELLGVVAASAAQRRHSHISSFKAEGYYRIAHPRDVIVPESCYTVRAARGGGPGGQGADSSSNKVELRASVAALSEHFDVDLIHKLKENERGKALTADESMLIITSHEHRSGHQNKETALQRLKAMIQKASWIPPVGNDPVKLSSAIITAQKMERRKKGFMRKMQRTARKGLW